MTKIELMEKLAHYKDDDELIVLWWDKDILEYEQEDNMDEWKLEWKKIVKTAECYDFEDSTNEVIEIINDIIKRVIWRTTINYERQAENIKTPNRK